MFKVLKSICVFKSTNRFIYEHICIDLSDSHLPIFFYLFFFVICFIGSPLFRLKSSFHSQDI